MSPDVERELRRFFAELLPQDAEERSAIERALEWPSGRMDVVASAPASVAFLDVLALLYALDVIRAELWRFAAARRQDRDRLRMHRRH